SRRDRIGRSRAGRRRGRSCSRRRACSRYTFRSTKRERSRHMQDEPGMIPMGGPADPDDAPAGPSDVPPTVKARNAVQQEVGRLLDALAPERAAHRTGTKTNEVERYRTPRGCVLQAAAGAVTVSWFPDSAQGAELGELQGVAWRGTGSHRS